LTTTLSINNDGACVCVCVCVRACVRTCVCVHACVLGEMLGTPTPNKPTKNTNQQQTGLRAVQAARPFPPLLDTLDSPHHVLPHSRAVLPPHTPELVGQRLEDLLATHAGLRDAVLTEVVAVVRRVVAAASLLEGEEGSMGRYQWLQVSFFGGGGGLKRRGGGGDGWVGNGGGGV
jgi:hypothetical protein